MYSTFLHLRFPFSFFLLPVSLFALSQSDQPDVHKVWLVFFILHFLVFPASNGYNSYFDKDEGSIGLLENPPPVGRNLYVVSLLLDALALVLSWFVSWQFLAFVLVYGLISKAYSHPVVRLKKYPVLSWLTVGFFQGAATYAAVFLAISEVNFIGTIPKIILPSLICTTNLLAIYPITQVYQHREDTQRGDLTMSVVLGINGTFWNALVFLGISAIGFFWYLSLEQFVILMATTAPMIVFLGVWFFRVRQDEARANFKNTMILNILAGICLNLFFGILCLLKFWAAI